MLLFLIFVTSSIDNLPQVFPGRDFDLLRNATFQNLVIILPCLYYKSKCVLIKNTIYFFRYF